jgi:hypothetical protein
MSGEAENLIREIVAIVEKEPPMEQWAFREIVKLIKYDDNGIQWFREATDEAMAAHRRKKYSDIFDHMIRRRLESA